MAQGLVRRPRLLMLDEPSAGLSPVLVDRVLVVVQRLRDDGIAVLLVEQLIEKALALADRVYALARGSIALEAQNRRARSVAPTGACLFGYRRTHATVQLVLQRVAQRLIVERLPDGSRLKNCRAFVAGASRGLGFACAKALAEEGARVFICSRNTEEL